MIKVNELLALILYKNNIQQELEGTKLIMMEEFDCVNPL